MEKKKAIKNVIFVLNIHFYSYSTSALLHVQVIENRMVAACSQNCQRQITAHYTSTKVTFTWECKQPISSFCSVALSRNFSSSYNKIFLYVVRKYV